MCVYNTCILTFNTSQVPTEIKVGYNLIKFSPYIPNPLRCYNCQKFGHHGSKCLKAPVCKKCGESGSVHIELSCSNPLKCPNCQGNHTANSKHCVIWKREKEVNRIKFTNNIPFPEARKIVQNTNLSRPNHIQMLQSQTLNTNTNLPANLVIHYCKNSSS